MFFSLTAINALSGGRTEVADNDPDQASLHGGMPKLLRLNPLAPAFVQATCQFDLGDRLVPAAEGVQDPRFATMPVLPPSGAVGRDGRGPFTYDINEIIENVRANGADIPVFLDHNSGAAHGWHDHLATPVQMPDGSWEWPVAYTSEGFDHLLSKRYRYNSPTWLYIQDPTIKDRVAGRIVGIHENSLVNLPNQYLRALNSRDDVAYTAHQPSTTVKPMTPEQLALLGLTAEATAEQISLALQSLKTAAELSVAIVEAAGAPAEADVAQVVEAAANSRLTSGALVTKQAFDSVVAERDAAVLAKNTAETALTAQATERAEQSALAAVDAAIAGGKFVPAARESLLKQARADLDTFNAVAAAMAVHPAARSVQAAQAPGPEATTEADAGAAYATQMLGIKSSVYEAGKKA